MQRVHSAEDSVVVVCLCCQAALWTGAVTSTLRDWTREDSTSTAISWKRDCTCAEDVRIPEGSLTEEGQCSTKSRPTGCWRKARTAGARRAACATVPGARHKVMAPEICHLGNGGMTSRKVRCNIGIGDCGKATADAWRRSVSASSSVPLKGAAECKAGGDRPTR